MTDKCTKCGSTKLTYNANKTTCRECGNKMEPDSGINKLSSKFPL